MAFLYKRYSLKKCGLPFQQDTEDRCRDRTKAPEINGIVIILKGYTARCMVNEPNSALASCD